MDDADGQVPALVDPPEGQGRRRPLREHVDPGRLLNPVAGLDGTDGECGHNGFLLVMVVAGRGC